jgi:hypothetical protein
VTSQEILPVVVNKHHTKTNSVNGGAKGVWSKGVCVGAATANNTGHITITVP